MSRLFTFGCSFTQYGWPTWADILGRQFAHYENWGRSGAGNLYISCAVSECHVKNQFNKNDTVVIMWSAITREDRYFEKGWHTAGNVYTQDKLFGKSWVKKFADYRGYLIRDLAFINQVSGFLDSCGVKYYFFSAWDISSPDLPMDITEDVSDVLWHYRAVIEKIRPSVNNIIFNYDCNNRPSAIIPRVAPVNALIPYKFTYVPGLIRQDGHPSPDEHLEYLDAVLPEIFIDADTRIWVNDITKKLQDPDFDIDTVWSRSKHVPTDNL
jgi:hypothetical protein